MTKALRCALRVFLVLEVTFAQQTEHPKPATQEKPPAAPQSQEKPAETTPKPDRPPEQRPAVHEAPGEKEKDKDKEEHFDMTESRRR